MVFSQVCFLEYMWFFGCGFGPFLLLLEFGLWSVLSTDGRC